MNLSAFVLNNKTAAENYQKVSDFIDKKHESIKTFKTKNYNNNEKPLPSFNFFICGF
jgi:hypothetical protein